MIKKHLFWLVIIFVIAALLRFYQLGSIPEGFFSDEAAVGYNAYSLLKTGKDEFGKAWPFFFTSFGEGKLPLYIYQALPSIGIFGLTEFATRFPGAFFGTLTILVWYFLFNEILRLSSLNSKLRATYSLLGAFVLAVMPWHIHFSRGVFGQEAIFWLVFGSWLILRGARKRQALIVTLGFIALSLSLLIYHSAKAILPIWMPFLFIFSWLKTKPKIIEVVKISLIGLVLLIATWGMVTFDPIGRTRAESMSVFSIQSGVWSKLHEAIFEEGQLNRPTWYTRIIHNKLESYGREVIGRYLSHFNPDFLFVSGDLLRARYRVPGVAEIYLIFLPFLGIGLYQLAKQKVWLILGLLLIAPLPAALTFETPSTVRALTMTVPLSGIIGCGLVTAYAWIKNWPRFSHSLILLALVTLFTYQFIYYLNSYFFLNQIHQPYDWQDGYKELVSKVDNLKTDYDQFVITDVRGTPYIFFLFFERYDPLKWQAQANQAIEPAKAFNFIAIRRLDNLWFVNEPCPLTKVFPGKTLYVCSQKSESSDVKLVDTIYYRDGQPAFYLLAKNTPKENGQ